MRSSVFFGLALGLGLAMPAVPVSAQADFEDAPPPLRDPAQALPGRDDGQSVLGGREAFDRGPQFQLGRRDRRAGRKTEDAYAQLTGDAQTLSYECDIGERVELVGADNLVTITGQCLGLNIVGNGNQVDIAVVDDVRIQGEGTDVRWGRGFTLARRDVMQRDGSNSARRRR